MAVTVGRYLGIVERLLPGETTSRVRPTASGRQRKFGQVRTGHRQPLDHSNRSSGRSRMRSGHASNCTLNVW